MNVVEKNVSLISLTYEEIQTLHSGLEASKREGKSNNPLIDKLLGSTSELIRDLQRDFHSY